MAEVLTMTDPHRPLTQNEVRGLFTNSPGHGATIRFSREFACIVCVLTRDGHAFDANFHEGLRLLVDKCAVNGVTLDPDAVEDIPPMDLRDPRETDEALEQQEKAFAGKGPVETAVTTEAVEARQGVARAEKPKKAKP